MRRSATPEIGRVSLVQLAEPAEANGTVPPRTLRQAQGPLRWWRSVTPGIDPVSLVQLAEPVEANGAVPVRTPRQARGAVRPVRYQREGSLADPSTSSGSAQVVTVTPGIDHASLIPLAEPVEANGRASLCTLRQARGAARPVRRQREGSLADPSTSSGSAQVVTVTPGIDHASLIPLAEPAEANGAVPSRTLRQAQGTARLARRLWQAQDPRGLLGAKRRASPWAALATGMPGPWDRCLPSAESRVDPREGTTSMPCGTAM